MCKPAHGLRVCPPRESKPRAERRDDEHIAAALVVEGVEDDLDIVLLEQAVRVAAHLGRDDGRRRRVVRVDADVEVPRVVGDADLGPFGGGLAFRGLLLNELPCRRRGGPGRVVQHAVQAGRRRHADGAQGRPPLGMMRLGGGGRGRGNGQQNERDDSHDETSQR